MAARGWLWVFAFVSSWIPSTFSAQGSDVGVIVERVRKGFAAEEASIQVGDVLLSWHRAPSPPANPDGAEGVFRTAFDVEMVQLEEAPRGRFEVSGLRAGSEETTFVVPPGDWGITVRPLLEHSILGPYLAAVEKLSSKVEETRREGWEEIRRWAVEAGERGYPDRASWLWWKMGGLARELAWWEELEESLGKAVEAAERLGDRARLAQIHMALGSGFEELGRYDDAVLQFEEALALRLEFRERSLAVAESVNGLGYVAWNRGELDAAEAYHHRALAIREELAPGSLPLAGSLHNLGAVARYRGDFSGAVALDRRALALRESLAPRSLDVAASWNSLGVVAFFQSRLTEAEDFHRRALARRRELVPGSRVHAWSLGNLGIVFYERGDLAGAESYLLRSIELLERQGLRNLAAAIHFNNLGAIALDRGRFEAAERYFRDSLKLRESSAPGSLRVAASLLNLGYLALERVDLASAEGFLKRALAINEEAAPESDGTGTNLNNLGAWALEAGNPAASEEYLRRALAIFDRLAPESSHVASVLHDLGEVAEAKGDAVAAEDLYRRALALWDLRAPGTHWQALTLHRLGRIQYQRQNLTGALGFFHQALDALEAQTDRLGGSEDTRGSFFARYGHFYQDTARLLVRLGRQDEAFQVVERSRARGLLALLAERDLVFEAGVPPALEEERRLAQGEHNRILHQLSELTAASEEETERELRAALAASRLRQDELRSRIRLAATLYPEPLNLAATQRLLVPGELLLSYSLGKEGGLLFAVGPGPEEYAVYELDVDGETLRSQVERFRAALEPITPLEQIRFLGASLSQALLGPVTGQLGRAQRLLILPDGPLHYLPFAVLPDPGSEAPARYLIEARPLSVVASATVLGELRQRRATAPTAGDPGVANGEPAAPTVVAFGDPRYPGPLAPDLDASRYRLRAVAERGLELSPLPHSRREVEGIQELFPRTSHVYLGEEATESRAKALAGTLSIVHFAAHGLIDEDQPLESALALSIPRTWEEGEENGLLQVWEIYEHLRLDADLVTLSACETALGREMAGEGIVGLSRAFQFAGARAVLASLWKVPDQSTAELMARFYRQLKAGRDKDEALRQAQLELLRGPIPVTDGETTRHLDATHPFYWAAFELLGDAR